MLLYENLYILSQKKLKEICKSLSVSPQKSKMDTSEIIARTIKDRNLVELMFYTEAKYELLRKLGSGKEGTVWEVKSVKSSKIYAMKIFDIKKSENRMNEEVFLQMIAAKGGISPEVVDVNLECKYIVMQKLDTLLFDVLKRRDDGIVTDEQQQEFIRLFNTLDSSLVFHGDPNLNNFMYSSKGEMMIIDFGMAKLIDNSLVKKHGPEPNRKLMTLGLIIKFTERNCPKQSIRILEKNL